MNTSIINTHKYLYWPEKIKPPSPETLECSDAIIKTSDWVFGNLMIKLTQIILYPIIFTSFIIVVYKTAINELSWPIFMVFTVNLLASLIFFPIQAKLKNLFLANIDITIIFSTLVIQTVLVSRHSDLLALMQIPHLIWAVIAMMVQFSLTYLNK